MLSYKAMYLPNGVHGEGLDFPGAITCGKNLGEARTLLSGALVDMAETSIMLGERLPSPNPELTESDADLEEPIYLILNASIRIKAIPLSNL